ncbi:MAG: hypothetical protein V1706_10785 [Pseudomonadota bacterium]
MNRIFYSALSVVTAFIITCCATTVVEHKPTGPQGKHVYKITALGFSRDIRDDAVKNAVDFCKKQDKHFKFVKNIFLPKSVSGVNLISVDLFFVCLEEKSDEPAMPEKEKGEVEEKPAMIPESVPEEEKNLKPDVELEESESGTAPVVGPKRKKQSVSTGDSPGEEESLGERTGSSGKEIAPLKKGGPIIEEILEE